VSIFWYCFLSTKLSAKSEHYVWMKSLFNTRAKLDGQLRFIENRFSNFGPLYMMLAAISIFNVLYFLDQFAIGQESGPILKY